MTQVIHLNELGGQSLLYVLLLLHISEYYVPLMFILSILNLFYCVVL